MVIHWPEQIKKMELFINDKPQNVPLGNRSFEMVVPHSRKMNVVLKAYISIDGTSISTLPLDVESPKDLIIDTVAELSESKSLVANRIYFLPEGHIHTNGYSLEIKSHKIFVIPEKNQIGAYYERAQLSTFPPGLTMKDSRVLLNSNISIEADYAYGAMSIALIGASGRSGRSGTEIEKSLGLNFLKDSLNGKKGADGFSQSKPCLKRAGMDLTDCDPTPVCIKQPEDGQSGQPGAHGHDGENGADGGDTGALIVNVQNHDDFSLEVTRKPGHGGLGGEPAPGHEGGDPGLPGASPAGCRKAVAGQKGAWGLPGKKGQDGRDGNYGGFHTNVKSQKVRDISASELY